ncbi:MAG: 4-hydroxy-tetrahydrodipicolinate reductase [Desulfobulbaceae bacterium S3730MH12]|nr:MAG: 4-hydroxy-tetrahydrodipicolinate reductase [Desulfobulbaceae bacterium S5133MH15]OEU56472.1 MAG: 4-hydroxy-tetrahydrodipicolinate reductase [Desulfobulbaceae bacterium S3730MH12]OEU82569.1 MAG: 4-hydroxy-tetrahydrodipicolinate reductase [Desulfobulbaceae bacterium C00003063]
MIKILIYGCGGTMGQVLANMAQAASDIEVVAGVDPVADATAFPFPVYAELDSCDKTFDVIVDFSRPESLGDLLKGALKKKGPLIIATTGHTTEDKASIKTYAESLPLFQAANMSLGINLMSDLIHKAASVLGEHYDVEIIEKHHNLKKDAPSGTAYQLAETINQAFMNSKNYVFDRHTNTEPRSIHEIGIHAVRGGTIVGEHQVLFAGTDEILEIRHNAYSKQVFAAGALQAVRFMVGKSPGYYTMKDMIAEESTITHMYTSDEEALVSMDHIPYDPVKITRIFKTIGEQKINLDMISQTAPVQEKVSISFTIPRKDVEPTMAILKSFQSSWPKLQVDVLTEITKITVQGPGMEVQSGVAARVFEVMTSKGIALKAITTSETKISYIIPEKDRLVAIEAIKTTFGI